jgi:hypothetical protein
MSFGVGSQTDALAATKVRHAVKVSLQDVEVNGQRGR